MDEERPKLEWIEPAPPEALIPDHSLWPWFLAAAVALVVIALLVWFFRKRKSTATDPRTLRDAAFAEAATAIAAISAENAREAAVQASLLLRKYLSAAAADPALFETHEEFIARHDSLQALNDTTRAAAAAGFSRLAALKYAPEIPGASATEIISDSRSLLETLHHGFAA